MDTHDCNEKYRSVVIFTGNLTCTTGPKLKFEAVIKIPTLPSYKILILSGQSHFLSTVVDSSCLRGRDKKIKQTP